MSNNNKINDWTVMVYLAGENNLAEEMVYALKSMQLVGSDPGTYEVVALYDGGLGPVTVEIGQSVSEDVTNLHAIGEKIRHVEAAQRKLDLKALVDEAEALKDKTEKAAAAAHVPGDSAAGKNGASIRYEKPRMYQGGAAAPVPDAPLQELLALVGPDSIKPGKPGTQSTATPAPRATLTESAQAFLKEALENNAEFKALEHDTADALHQELQSELTALNKGHRVDQPVGALLAEFVIEAIKKHEAKNYMLVLSGHGSGAVGDFLPGNGGFSSLTIPELKVALDVIKAEVKEREGKAFKLGILGFDSCLMGMAEVAYEVKDYAHYLVGSEGFEPNTGWPYDLILNLLKSSENRELENLPGKIVEEYIKFYSSDYTLAEVSTHLCAMNLAKIEGLAEKLKVLAGQLQQDLEIEKKQADDADKASRKNGNVPRNAPRKIRDAVLLAHWESQGFKLEQHVDLWDFCDCLEQRAPTDLIAKVCNEVKTAIINENQKEESLVLFSDYCGPAFQFARGLSIFFPWTDNTDAAGTPEMEHYKASLDFAVDTGWHRFVSEYHKATQRDPRPGKGTSFESTLNHHEGLFTGKPGKFGLMSSPRFGLMSSPRFGLMSSPRFGLMSSPRFGLMSSPRFGLMSSPRFGLMSSPRFGLMSSPRFGLMSSPRFGGGGGLAKIESMKNPPTKWQMQKPKKD